MRAVCFVYENINKPHYSDLDVECAMRGLVFNKFVIVMIVL